ncbi:MAG: sugar phosphate isomerase/epimerase family protein [Candidatus Latescibacterota bacterium]
MGKWATGIFTSIDEGLGAGLDAVRELGVDTVHLHAPTAVNRTEERTKEIREQFLSAQVDITVVFIGFPEDDYSTTDIVKETVGLVPEKSRKKRLVETLQIADFARSLGVDAIGMHLGFVPPDSSDPAYTAIVETTRTVCDHCRSIDQYFHLETGQETAGELLEFIGVVGRDNLAVNFDPANMILYGAGNPIEALDIVGNHVRSVHCKDASYQRQPGQPWYEDAPLGRGDVGMEVFLRKLDSLGYGGPLTIEREYSPDQAGDIKVALELLRQLRAEILN